VRVWGGGGAKKAGGEGVFWRERPSFGFCNQPE